MIRQILLLEDWNWSVRVFYDVGTNDIGRVLNELELIGCSDDTLKSADDNLANGTNVGLTYSNVIDRTTVIVISRTTSASEFADTFFHEIMHCAFHIAGALEINPYSEEFGYLAGEISRQMFKVAKQFMCESCRRWRQRVMS